MRVEVDYDLCESNGVCMGINPEVFDLGDDDVLRILRPQITPATEDDVREAVRRCPRQALCIVETEGTDD
ncbi:ferredoxin [Mycolicibacter heraklionensis]|uniref:Ferredoxin n=1 Tax=Mycolicibacter heraklionensis TaxID=512402 RepID=A0ABR5FF97_9MYCO|nr:ferredoxin [Mycolicibacter heraklionensis]KLO28750.1 ferredoxin [Mycolicibacter heraklionensis]